MQYTFCRIQQIALRSPLAVHSECALKKTSGVHIQSWLCKWETNKVDRAEPYTIPANPGIVASGAQKGWVQFYWLLSSNVNNLSPESRSRPSNSREMINMNTLCRSYHPRPYKRYKNRHLSFLG